MRAALTASPVEHPTQQPAYSDTDILRYVRDEMNASDALAFAKAYTRDAELNRRVVEVMVLEQLHTGEYELVPRRTLTRRLGQAVLYLVLGLALFCAGMYYQAWQGDSAITPGPTPSQDP